MSSFSNEIARSYDVFIKHNFQNHDGEIPIWAAVEVMSFGTLLKIIKNLKTGDNSSYSVFANYYCYRTQNERLARPSKDMLIFWIQVTSVLRNMCAHNSRIYNRAINTAPQLPRMDQISPPPQYNGLYQVILALKYLRPHNVVWNQFVSDLSALFEKYDGTIEFQRLNFPENWIEHFTIEEE